MPADVVVGSNAAERALMTVDPSARCDSPRCVGKDRRDADVRHHASGRGSDNWMIMREAMLIAGAVESRLLRPMKIHMIVQERMQRQQRANEQNDAWKNAAHIPKAVKRDHEVAKYRAKSNRRPPEIDSKNRA